jgi:Haem-binding domain
MRRFVKPALIVIAAVFGAMQLVPYGWDHSNPEVTEEAPWPSEQARAIAQTACYDCHSNETDWPAYSYVAPMSWLVRRDVDNGREALNFSTWDQGEQEAHEGAETIEEGSMPPSQYEMLHPDARLSDEEQQILIDALEQMDEGGGNRGPGGGDDDDDDDGGGGDDDRSGSNSGPG